MNLNALIEVIQGELRPLVKALEKKEQIPALGLRRAARLPLLLALHQATARPILLISDRGDHVLNLFLELETWLPGGEHMFFPEPTPLFYEPAAWGERTRKDRLMALTRLAQHHIPGAFRELSTPLIIAPARALMTRTIPRHEFLKATRHLKRGQSISLIKLVRHCVELGYEPANIVVASGQFAHRGGILDIWPPAEKYPLRIEFFGDDIETIRAFDPGTQRTVKVAPDQALQSILITPAREFLRPATEQKDDYSEISEYHIPVLHQHPASVLDYLPRNSLVVFDNPQMLIDTVDEVETQAVKLRSEMVAEGLLAEDFPTPYLSWSEIQDALERFQTLTLGFPSVQDLEIQPIQEAVFDWGERFQVGPRFGGRLKHLIDYVYEKAKAGETVILLSRQITRLKELWETTKSQNLPVLPTFLEGSLDEGWRLELPQKAPVNLLTDGEIFGWRRPEPRRRPRPVAEAPESPYADLIAGDYVVHVDHGIGRYIGLVQRTVEGVEREYLCIEYANETRLFVPVYQADRLTRYIGPRKGPPALNHLGGTEWRNTKARVREAVKEIAEDLLELYARRSIIQGYAFSADTPWQQELEASFPYIETDDQVQVIQEVKNDMQRDQPMDRLICGDVGYGKTEVALRAAFKAVMDNKQVAMLVPTTVLAQQHFNTFQQRLAAFPVSVEMLSRFRTTAQQKEILNKLEKGKVDIVIGTHRLLSADVRFKDLGLLIIDEEQRFGVTHKERLKQMRTEVDVLTLTATPIPRTLYMALSGIRDISMINTPPEERLPIITHVGPYSPRLVRQAILRELERGGQVFFVHNRVLTIEAMYSHLKHLVPEARIAIAHGQMPESQLSSVMQAFTDAEVDVLLCTSIIESGLDIPNANTLIVDRADTFGLAQLYQLRGRVGRGAQRAFAYFFRHRKKLPTPDGRRRLETIAENTQLGSGFSIAMRDLEIRGAGDVLGTRQHGHIAAVGFHLYTNLLSEAVRRLRYQRGLADMVFTPAHHLQLNPINVELPITVQIPSSYVPDKEVRLGLYRRLAQIRSLEEINSIDEEFADRFGPPPQEVINLLYQLKVKVLAEQAGLASISTDNGQLALRFPEDVVPDKISQLPTQVRVGKTALWMPYREDARWKDSLLQLLDALKRNPKNQSKRG